MNLITFLFKRYEKLAQKELFPYVTGCILLILLGNFWLEYSVGGLSPYAIRDLLTFSSVLFLVVLYYVNLVSDSIVYASTGYLIVLGATLVLPLRLDDVGFYFEGYYIKTQLVTLVMGFTIGFFVRPIHLLLMGAYNLVYNFFCMYAIDVYPTSKFIYYSLLMTFTILMAYRAFVKALKLTKEIELNNKLISYRNKELSSINKFKNDLIKIIGHDLRSPINNVISMVEIRNETEDPIEKEQCLTYVKTSAENASNLLTEILAWANDYDQGDTGNMAEEINVYSCVAKGVELLHDNARLKSLTISNDIDQNQWLRFGKYALETVSRNLISNAIKYSNPNSKIEVTTEISSNQYALTVRDYGVGIPPEIAKNLNANNSITSSLGTSDEKGTGNGLKICYDLVKLFQGELILKNMGDGTAATVLLPKSYIIE